jgi:hypothetical protein
MKQLGSKDGAVFLLDLFLDPEDGAEMFLRYV